VHFAFVCTARFYTILYFDIILSYNIVITGVYCTLQRNDDTYHYDDNYYDYSYGSGDYPYDYGSGPEDHNEVGSSGIISYAVSAEFLLSLVADCVYMVL